MISEEAINNFILATFDVNDVNMIIFPKYIIYYMNNIFDDFTNYLSKASDNEIMSNELFQNIIMMNSIDFYKYYSCNLYLDSTKLICKFKDVIMTYPDKLFKYIILTEFFFRDLIKSIVKKKSHINVNLIDDCIQSIYGLNLTNQIYFKNEMDECIESISTMMI
jgi:hypothetical protein